MIEPLKYENTHHKKKWIKIQKGLVKKQISFICIHSHYRVPAYLQATNVNHKSEIYFGHLCIAVQHIYSANIKN